MPPDTWCSPRRATMVSRIARSRDGQIGRRRAGTSARCSTGRNRPGYPARQRHRQGERRHPRERQAGGPPHQPCPAPRRPLAQQRRGEEHRAGEGANEGGRVDPALRARDLAARLTAGHDDREGRRGLCPRQRVEQPLEQLGRAAGIPVVACPSGDVSRALRCHPHPPHLARVARGTLPGRACACGGESARGIAGSRPPTAAGNPARPAGTRPGAGHLPASSPRRPRRSV